MKDDKKEGGKDKNRDRTLWVLHVEFSWRCLDSSQFSIKLSTDHRSASLRYMAARTKRSKTTMSKVKRCFKLKITIIIIIIIRAWSQHDVCTHRQCRANTFSHMCRHVCLSVRATTFRAKMTGVQCVTSEYNCTHKRAHKTYRQSNGPRGMSGAELQVFAQLQVWGTSPKNKLIKEFSSSFGFFGRLSQVLRGNGL